MTVQQNAQPDDSAHWETVDRVPRDGVSGQSRSLVTARLSVPDGWLYRTVQYRYVADDDRIGDVEDVTTTFVPHARGRKKGQ